jgi:transcriptional regulator with XRE-family HTH domain
MTDNRGVLIAGDSRMGLDPKKILARRKAMGITQEQAGLAAGFEKLPKQTWARYESGRETNVKLDKAVAIAKALGVTVNDLLR